MEGCSLKQLIKCPCCNHKIDINMIKLDSSISLPSKLKIHLTKTKDRFTILELSEELKYAPSYVQEICQKLYKQKIINREMFNKVYYYYV